MASVTSGPGSAPGRAGLRCPRPWHMRRPRLRVPRDRDRRRRRETASVRDRLEWTPSTRNAASPRNNSTFCSAVFPKPRPGSTTMRSAGIPAARARPSACPLSAITVANTPSAYFGVREGGQLPALPRECIRMTPARRSAHSARQRRIEPEP
jgi:hypothetical protein